jgi:hypothetical protein
MWEGPKEEAVGGRASQRLNSQAVRGGLRTLIVALAALLIAAAFAACGGSDSGTTEPASVSQPQSESKSASGTSKQDNAEGGDESKPSVEEKSDGGSSPDASDFVPKQHSDSGGGAEQFKVKGGDNSIQEFGEEADSSEFDEAANAVHNFLDARAEGDWAAACEYMSKGIAESFKQLAAQGGKVEDTSCAGVLEALTNPAAKQSMKAEAEKANVGSLRIEDERAFVIYTGSEGTVFAMPMANEDGAWKVASLAGTPIS